MRLDEDNIVLSVSVRDTQWLIALTALSTTLCHPAATSAQIAHNIGTLYRLFDACYSGVEINALYTRLHNALPDDSPVGFAQVHTTDALGLSSSTLVS